MSDVDVKPPQDIKPFVMLPNNEFDFTADDTTEGTWGPDEQVVKEFKPEIKKKVEDDPEQAEKDKEPKPSYTCDLCKGTYEGQTQQVHERLPKHQKMLVRLEKYGTTEITPEMHTFHCHICGTISNSPEQLLIHKKGTKHRTRCLNMCIDPDLTEIPAGAKKSAGLMSSSGESLSCNVCMVMASSLQQLNQHLSGKKHKEKMRQLQALGGQNASRKRAPGQPQNSDKQRQPRNDGAAAGHASRSGAAEPEIVDQAGKSASKRAHEDDAEEEATAAKKQALEGSGPDTAKLVMPFYCDVCSIYLNSTFQMNEHKKGKGHLDRVQKKEKGTVNSEAQKANGSSAPEAAASDDVAGPAAKKPAKKQSEPMECKVCKLTLNSTQQYEQHITSKKHLMKAAGGNARRQSSGAPGQRPPFRRGPGATGSSWGQSMGQRQRGPNMNWRPAASNMGASGPRAPAASTRLRGPGMGTQPQGLGMGMGPQGPGMNIRPQGLGMGMRPQGPGMNIRPQGLGMSMRSEGPGMNIRSQGLGMSMRSEGPGMNIRSQGLGMSMRSEGPGMNIRSQGLGMSMRSEGPGMNIRSQGLEMSMRSEGPGVAMRSQRPGMAMRPRGPGMSMGPLDRAESIGSQRRPLSPRPSSLLDFEPGHQTRQTRGPAARRDFVDESVHDHDYRDRDYGDSNYEDSSYDHGYDGKERGFGRVEDYENARYPEPTFDEYGSRGLEPEDAYGPPRFEEPCREEEFYPRGSRRFPSPPFPNRIATYGERRSDVERSGSLMGPYEDRPAMRRYGGMSSSMRDSPWSSGLFSRRRPLVDF